MSNKFLQNYVTNFTYSGKVIGITNPEYGGYTAYISDPFSKMNDQEREKNYPYLITATHLTTYDQSGYSILSTPLSRFINRPELDDPTKNTSVGTGPCELVNLCVPSVNVPSTTLDLVDEVTKDEDGNIITGFDIEMSNNVNDLANQLPNISDVTTPESLLGSSVVNTRFDKVNIETNPTEINTVPLSDPKDIQKHEDLSTKLTEPVTTENNVAQTPVTKIPIPDYSDICDKELEDIILEVASITKDNIDTTLPEVDRTNIDKFAAKEREGSATFNQIMSSVNILLQNANSMNLLDKNTIGKVYAELVPAVLQTALQFNLSKEQSNYEAETARQQAIQAQLQTAMMRSQVKLQAVQAKGTYYQMLAQKRQAELLGYQMESQKYQLPLLAAQIDQARTQVSLLELDKVAKVEEVKQFELNRAAKQAQVTNANLNNQITAEKLAEARLENQANLEKVKQAKQATHISIAQLEKLNEETKLISAQTAVQLENAKLGKANLIKMTAEMKALAASIRHKKTEIRNLKANAAATFAQVAATTESMKAVKAQYSDTINGVPIGGTLGAQILVNKAQAEGFHREAAIKFLAQIQSGWSTKKTADMAVQSPDAFTALTVDRIINFVATNSFNMPRDINILPSDYKDTMTSAELDGDTPSGYPR